MSKTLLATLLATGMAVASLPALAQNAQTATKEDQTFVTKAIEGNLAEIEMGKLAQQKAESQEIKDFGATLVQDHTDANNKAMDLAKQINLTNTPTQTSKKNQQEYERLSKMNGAQFDRDFVQHMVSDHKQDVAEFTKQSKMKSGDPTTTFASQVLPVLEKHLQTAESLEKNVKK